jgi:hypothetical protein
MGPTRKFARLEFNRVAARPLGTAGGAAGPFARTMIEAAVCLANEMIGGADRLREDALATLLRDQLRKVRADRHWAAVIMAPKFLAWRGTFAYQQRVRCEPASDRRRFHEVTLN